MSDKAKNQAVLEVTKHFLDAIDKRQDWRPFSQLRAKNMKASPSIPAFQSYEILRTHIPGRGLDPDTVRAVWIDFTLGGDDRNRLQKVTAKLLVVLETEEEVCRVCGGEGADGEGTACAKCGGTGWSNVVPPRQPVKGSETYDADVKNGKWGVCPTSFEYVAGTQRAIT